MKIRIPGMDFWGDQRGEGNGSLGGHFVSTSILLRAVLVFGRRDQQQHGAAFDKSFHHSAADKAW